MKSKAKTLVEKYRGNFSVLRFNEDKNRYFECIPDNWFVDENKVQCFWPPKGGKSFSYRAMTGEPPDDSWDIVDCVVISEGHVTYSSGFHIVREKCAQRYNTSSAEDEIQAAKFRREHPALVLKENMSFEHIFNKPSKQLQQNVDQLNNVLMDNVSLQQPSVAIASNPTTCTDKTSQECVDVPSNSTTVSKSTNSPYSSSTSDKKKSTKCQPFLEQKRKMLSIDSSTSKSRKVLAGSSSPLLQSRRSRSSSNSRSTSGSRSSSKSKSSSGSRSTDRISGSGSRTSNLKSKYTKQIIVTPSPSSSSTKSSKSHRSKPSSRSSSHSRSSLALSGPVNRSATDGLSKRSRSKSIVSRNSIRRSSSLSSDNRSRHSRSLSVEEILKQTNKTLKQQYNSRTGLKTVDNNSSEKHRNETRSHQYHRRYSPESSSRSSPSLRSSITRSPPSMHISATEKGVKRSRSRLPKNRTGSFHRRSTRSRSDSRSNRSRSKSHPKLPKAKHQLETRNHSVRNVIDNNKTTRMKSSGNNIKLLEQRKFAINEQQNRSHRRSSRSSDSRYNRSRSKSHPKLSKAKHQVETRNRPNNDSEIDKVANNTSSRMKTTSSNNTELLEPRYKSKSPNLSKHHTSRRNVFHSTNFALDIKKEIKDVQNTLQKTNEHLEEYDSRLERIEVTVNKMFLILGDMAQRNYCMVEPDVENENESDFDVPRLPIRDQTKLAIFQRKLKDKKFKEFLINREKEFCAPIGRQTDTVIITKYLQRFISLKLRSKIPLKEKGKTGLTLFDNFHRVYGYLIDVTKAGYKARNKGIMVDDAYQALRVVWGRTKQMMKEKEIKEENRNRKRHNKNPAGNKSRRNN